MFDRLVTRPAVIALLVLVVVLGAGATVQSLRLAWEQTSHANTKKQVVETLSEIGEKTRKAEVAAQRARDTYVLNTAENAIAHAEGVTNAYQKGLAAARSIMSGDSSLREHWRGCPTPAAGGDAADPAAHQALAQRRAESAGRIIGLGAGADNDYKALYAEYLNTRTLLASCYEKKPE